MDETQTTAIATVQIDDDLSRVTEWRFPPGTQTGLHTHELPYVVVPTSTGTLRVYSPDGDFDNVLAIGASYARPAGSTHNVVNESDEECVFVEVEFKQSSHQ